MEKLGISRLRRALRLTKLALSRAPWSDAGEAAVTPDGSRAVEESMFDDPTRNELMQLATRLLEGLKQNKNRETIGALAVRLAATVCDDTKPRLRTASGRDKSWGRYTILDSQETRGAIEDVLREAIDPLTNPSFDIEMALPELLILAKSILEGVRKETVDPQVLMEAAVRLALFVHYVDVWILAGRELPPHWRAKLARRRRSMASNFMTLVKSSR
jgi:hypothetical protein